MQQLQKFSSILVTGLMLVCALMAMPAKAEQASLLDTVTSQLGISSEQASGALGSLFSMAQSSMSGGDFSDLSSIVPDMSDLLKAAPEVESSEVGGLLGGLGGDLGKTAGNLDMLNSSLSALGLDPELAGPLVNTVYEYVQTEGGQAMLTSLKNSLGLPF
ncbi:DUF2780 domain-containing protein [Neiella marina]|uniref:DUF2780 domain-containing protein n=1 Tax=Neiella holothuriorum TaxID=2870530 RepID=A0ABS7EKH3_9GAMM|nr:DUF2780 domain-containing protein [Neiella holothuriorum]MBW8192829.1 DUF2780 domain-containing protein [Neiella holothuriorum]